MGNPIPLKEKRWKMRKRNILKTIYLNEEENKLLIDECNKLGISHSEYIRNMIVKFGPKNIYYKKIN